MVALLLDGTAVQNSSGQSSGHGEVFYAGYRSTLNHHFVMCAKDFIPLLVQHADKESGIVGNVLCGVLDHVTRDRNLRKK